VTREEEWRLEFEALRAERAVARRKWRGAADGLAERARDPLGLRGLVKAHPIAATGIGAAVGALLVKMLFGRRKDPDVNGQPPSALSAVLRNAVVGVAVPWLLRTVKEKFGWGAGEAEAPPASGSPR
jgi:hypothetical protein